MNVLITGCSTGFGEITAKTLALGGHRVFASMRDVAGRNAEPAATLGAWAAQWNVRLRVVEMDVASTPSVEAAAREIEGLGGNIDVIVNNAGVAARGPIEAFS